MELTKMYGELGISEKVLNYGREIEKSLHDRFEAIDKTAEYNQLKVIKAMQITSGLMDLIKEISSPMRFTDKVGLVAYPLERWISMSFVRSLIAFLMFSKSKSPFGRRSTWL